MRVVGQAGQKDRLEARRWASLARVCVVLAGLALGCSNDSPTGPGPTPGSSLFVLSGPIAATSAASTPVMSGPPSGPLVTYVSLPPGAIPGGITASIRVPRTGATVTTELIGGGFDPVAIVALAGDTLAITVQVVDGNPRRFTRLVPESSPPIVIRTDPPAHKRDVPLNAAIVIVFSQPIDPATLTTGTLQLWRDLTPVAGAVRSSDGAHLRAEFRPDTLLTGHTDYQVAITSAIHDVNGVALDSLTEVVFTTGESVQVATRLAFLNGGGVVVAGALSWVRVAIEDSLGVIVQGATDSVTLDLDANPGGAILAGALTVAAVDGIASFPDVSLDKPGASYTFAAKSGALTGATSARFTVVEPSADLVFASVSAGGAHSCGVTTSDVAYCWGANGGGQLGVGDIIQVAGGPVPVAGNLGFSEVRASVYYTCGRTAAGAAYCWGDGPTGLNSTPVPVAAGLTFASLSAGGDHACGVTTAGDAYCWGYNPFGQLGAGDQIDRPSPVLVTGGLSFTSVGAGSNHTCGLTTTGIAYCWGRNTEGELGDGTTIDRSIPVLVSGGLSFASVSVGASNSCGLTTAGAAYCWGMGAYGQLGNGAYADRTSPVPVAGGLSFATLTAGDWNACAVTADGAAYCWGANDWGDLGNGSVGSRNTPTLVAGGLSFVAVSPGFYHSCGVTVAGVAYCWGWGLGLGDVEGLSQTLVPVKVGGQP